MLPPVQLTAYTGVQPEGFTVATAPSGRTVRSSDAFAFVVQPPDDTNHLEGDFENARKRPCFSSPTERGTRWWCRVLTKYHLTDDQIVQFADSVGVTDAVRVGTG